MPSIPERAQQLNRAGAACVPAPAMSVPPPPPVPVGHRPLADRFESIEVQWAATTVQHAPARSLVSLELLANLEPRAVEVARDRLLLGKDFSGESVEYKVVGWHAESASLIVDRVNPPQVTEREA